MDNKTFTHNCGNSRLTDLTLSNDRPKLQNLGRWNSIFDNRKQLMKVTEVMAYLNISRSHLYTQMKTKGLPYLKVAGSTRFEREAVELWLKKWRHNS